jgi:hypothetical protein
VLKLRAMMKATGALVVDTTFRRPVGVAKGGRRACDAGHAQGGGRRRRSEQDLSP